MDQGHPQAGAGMRGGGRSGGMSHDGTFSKVNISNGLHFSVHQKLTFGEAKAMPRRPADALGQAACCCGKGRLKVKLLP
jgi:hypothetical protein